MKSSNNAQALIEIGKIVGAHGIHGVVKVYSYADSVASFTQYGPVTIVDPRGEQTQYAIVWAKPHKKIIRVCLEGITTRNGAEDLAGHRICISKDQLPALDDDTFYWADIIGMDVFTVDADYLGTVVQIIPTGANDVYVVRPPKDFPADEILIPSIESVVRDIDVTNKRIQVEMPDGLIEPASGNEQP